MRNTAGTVSPEHQRAACLPEAARPDCIVEETDVHADAESHRPGRTEDRAKFGRWG